MPLKGPIICIEDDKDDQLLIGEAIKELQLPNEVCFFIDGEAALEFLNATTKKPFLILCDTNLPIMNGIELRKRLSENEYLRRKSIPFVFVTTSVNPALVQTAYDITVQGYFKKPYSYIDLKQQIKLIIAYWSECLHPYSEL
ncbi:response regulator [Spirosoma endbachense]|uniref:Response regulator n=1 Tax=Spirosoma endbachense TaxID=2666025 RepID=A0A6P1VU03_9BACT|nr:response regulator [Spirosoma endbachense]QHV96701.1 response regulator [Spirosoma endbachense]